MEMDGLPGKDCPHLRLVVATPDELHAQHLSNSVEWKGALDLEAYLRREHVLRTQELTDGGGFTAWMLVYQPNGATTRRVLCGCETIKKKGLVAQGGELKETVSYGIGSVFCPPENRGMGYAGVMMDLVAKRLPDLEGPSGSTFSVLYSDIGKDFYAARGWHPWPSSHVSLHAMPSTPAGVQQVRLLESSDLADFCKADERLLRLRMSRRPATSKPAVALVPDLTTMLWHHAREDFIAEELFKRKITYRGAVVGEPGGRVWCYWTRVWPNPQENSPNTLHILRLAIEDSSFDDFLEVTEGDVVSAQGSSVIEGIAAVLAAARAEASRWDMKHVELWNPTSTSLVAAQRLDAEAGVVHRATESIASLQWYGAGPWQDVVWLCNEKYGWV